MGARVELARYSVPGGERVLYGQRIEGRVRVTDHLASQRPRTAPRGEYAGGMSEPVVTRVIGVQELP